MVALALFTDATVNAKCVKTSLFEFDHSPTSSGFLLRDYHFSQVFTVIGEFLTTTDIRTFFDLHYRSDSFYARNFCFYRRSRIRKFRCPDFPLNFFLHTILQILSTSKFCYAPHNASARRKFRAHSYHTVR